MQSHGFIVVLLHSKWILLFLGRVHLIFSPSSDLC